LNRAEKRSIRGKTCRQGGRKQMMVKDITISKTTAKLKKIFV